MNYIKQLNAFYKLIRENAISTKAQCLYHYLLMANNELSWAKTFTKSNFEVCGVTQMDRRTLDRIRNELKQKGLIEYEKGTSNQAGTYRIIPLYKEMLSDIDDTQKCPPSDIDDTQRGASDIDDTQNVTQDVTQLSHTMTTLNKLETKSIYFNLLNKAREKFEISNFGQRVIAYAWCKSQPQFAKLDYKEQLEMLNQL